MYRSNRSTPITTGCAARTPVTETPIPAGQGRLWVYRIWLPSESLNLANIDVNGVYFGSVENGGVFYRDVPPGPDPRGQRPVPPPGYPQAPGQPGPGYRPPAGYAPGPEYPPPGHRPPPGYQPGYGPQDPGYREADYR